MGSLASEKLERLKDVWSRASPTQRLLVVGLGIALAAAIGLGLFLNRTQWVVLVNQADPKDAAAIVARLQELKVPYQPTGDGYTILVPKTEQYTAKLALAQTGLPKGTSVGMELFDNPQFGATDFDRKVNYLRAQQGELERALSKINELEYANVKLAIPEKSVFIRDQTPVTAAVLVQTRPGRRLAPDQVEGIINFLASSVQGLTRENTTVVDQSGRMLSNGGAAVSQQPGLAGDQLAKQQEMQQQLEHSVQTLLEPVFGSGNVITRVNLELSLETSKIESTTVGGATPKQTEVVRESGQAVPNGSSLPPATGTPPTYQTPTGSGSGDQYKSRTTTQYELSTSKEVKVVGAGGIKRVSVGIAINRVDLSPDQITQIKESVAGATGADVAGINVTAMAFNRPPASPAVSSPAGSSAATPLVLGLGAVALILVVTGLIIGLRRNRGEQSADELLSQAAAANPLTGQSLDVLLGMPSENAGQTSWTPGQVVSTKVHADVAEPPAAETPSAAGFLQSLSAVGAKQALSMEEEPPDEVLSNMVLDAIDNNPEACADLIREWLKGAP